MSVLLVAFRRLELLFSTCKVMSESRQQRKTEKGTTHQSLSSRYKPGGEGGAATCTYLLELSEEGPLEKRLLRLLLHRQLHKLPAALRFDTHAGETAFPDAAEDDVQRAGQQAGVCLRT